MSGCMFHNSIPDGFHRLQISIDRFKIGRGHFTLHGPGHDGIERVGLQRGMQGYRIGMYPEQGHGIP